ncbi:MAG: flagellar hook-length control protein FliK [Candidatus Nitrotoga sp. SPKER]|nr:MAG: flagellar hook-length control protein FliK [Candidatus Nitrotoga sp. SPKER]
MQNIITPMTSPAIAAQTPSVAVSEGTLPTETFGNLLARQLVDSTQPTKTDTSYTDLPAFSATDNILTATSSSATDNILTTISNSTTDTILTATSSSTPDTMLTAISSNEQSTEPQALTLDISTLPNNMLAALLPSNLAPQMSISHAQPTQPEALSFNRAQSIATNKVSSRYDTPATTLEILNSGMSNKSMKLLADTQLTVESSPQASAPQPNATTMVALQASVPNVTHLNSSISLSVDIPVTHKAWADEFSQKIVWVTTQQGQSAELHLNPPQLGPVDVVIKVDGDQATALFTSAHAVVRDAIEQALPKLREMLADSGIMLSNATVSDQSPKEQQTKQTDQPYRKESRQTQIEDTILVGNTQVRSSRYQQGSVDTFA